MIAEKWEKELVGPVFRRKEIELYLLKIQTVKIYSSKVNKRIFHFAFGTSKVFKG